MCDSVTQNKINTVVEAFVNSKRTFTAFEVTLEVQSLLKNSGDFDINQHRHRHIKNDIHKALQAYIDNGSYDRELLQLENGNEAWNYKPKVSPSDSVTIVSTLGKTQVPTVTKIKNEPGTPDARGTVTVPSNLLRKMNLNPKDKVIVVNNDTYDAVDIVRTDYSLSPLVNESSKTKYTVDSSGNVRITLSKLLKNRIGDKKVKFTYIPCWPGIRVEKA